MKMMAISSLRAGDVLLCYKKSKSNKPSNIIRCITNSAYTHAAICVDSNTAAEAMKRKGVSKIQIMHLIHRYDHVAVFRQPDAWRSSERIQALNTFIDCCIETKAKYNISDVMKFKKKHEEHQSSIIDKLDRYANNYYKPASVVQDSYFCSEFVVSCFVKVGFIDESAHVVYQQNVMSPGALGRDPTFGTFCGYISKDLKYTVPDTDEFYSNSTYGEIFGDEN